MRQNTWSWAVTRTVVLGGLLVAVSVVLTRFLSLMIPLGGAGAIRLGLGPVPIMLAGIFAGPFTGATVGLVADLVGFTINPMGGPFIPELTVVSALYGVIPALVLRRVRGAATYSFREVLLAVIITQFTLAVVVSPWVLFRYFGIPLQINVPLRLLAQVILIPLYTLLIQLVHARVGRFTGSP
jgi:ECF transporter S component (folate family)